MPPRSLDHHRLRRTTSLYGSTEYATAFGDRGEKLVLESPRGLENLPLDVVSYGIPASFATTSPRRMNARFE
jgi:hypothetical protein